MCTQDHVASSIDDAIVRVGCNIIQEEVHCFFCGDCGLSLSRGYGTEGHNELVIHCTCVVQKNVNDFLDSEFTRSIKESRSVCFGSELGLCTIGDGHARIGR